MRRSARMLSVLAAVAVAAVPAFGQGQEGFEGMLPQATAEHELLKHEVGTWDAKITASMGGPDQPPTVSEGAEVNRMLGDLWLICDFEGDFEGMPFTGHSQIGYDPTRGEFVMSWVDSMNPTLSTLSGTYDADSKTMTFIGEVFDPMLNKKVEQKTTSTVIDEDHKRFELLMKAPEYGDDWVSFMTIEYTRRADDPAK